MTYIFYSNPQYIRKNSFYHLTSRSKGTFISLSHFIIYRSMNERIVKNYFIRNCNENLNRTNPFCIM